MNIKYNPNEEYVFMIKKQLAENDGYCPCRIIKSPDTKCMCKEFRDQIKDPYFEGYCHCMLFFKEK